MIPVQLLTPFWRTFQVPKDEMPEGTRQKCEESAIISAMEKAKASIKAPVVFWVELLGRRFCIFLGLSRIRCWKQMGNASLASCPLSHLVPGQGPNHFRKSSGAKTRGGAWSATCWTQELALHTEERHHAECWTVLDVWQKAIANCVPGEWFSGDFCLLHK